MLEIAQTYQRRFGERAPEMFARDLMRDEPASFKRGYSLESAVLATGDAFELSDDERLLLGGKLLAEREA